MNFDQYEEPRPEQVELARGVAVLLSVLIDESGAPRDLADKKGREALIRAISDIPREIPAKLNEEDRRLLNESLPKAVEEMRKTQKAIRFYIRWGCVAVAVSILVPIVAAFFMIHHYGSEELWCRIQNCLG